MPNPYPIWRAALLALTILPSLAPAQQPDGPCTRRTSIVLSEIHYHPPGDALASAEFIELYNSSPISVDLSGWKLRGDADFDFPQGTRLAGGELLLVAADPNTLTSAGVTGTILGPWTGDLSNNNGTVRLRKASGGIALETNYRDDSPWPLAADGAGHSLVLAHPAIGETRPGAWSASTTHGGSPNSLDPAPTTDLENIVISEIAAAGTDFVEFHNPGTTAVDLSGCFLTNNRDLPGTAIPAGTTIAPGAYASFTTVDFDATGDSIYLRAPDGLQVIAARKFDGQEEGHPWGGIDGEWRERQTATPGTANSPPNTRPVVINELHYHPVGGENDGEFIELHNTGTTAADLSGWKLEDGVEFEFPPATTIPAGGFLVIAENRTALLAIQPGLDPAIVLGDYSGSLSNSSERIALTTPQNVTADEVTYFDGGRWPSSPDGGGTSLQLADPRSDNSLAPNWTSGDESAKAVTFTVEHTGVTDLGHQKAPQATRFFIMMMDGGEAIIDDVEVLVGGNNRVANGDFASGLSGWKTFGTHEPTFAENGALHVVATRSGDIANLIETTLTSPIPPDTTVTLRAQCRWVSGNPQILLGLNGGWQEAPGTLPVPEDVGTPGAANFSTGNVGPAITDVTHSPVLPAAGEPITVTARVADPDGIATVRLRYRLDPASSTSQITMTDTGDGLYSATIPAQNAATLIAFHVLSIDSASPGVITRFPADATDRECLVRVGDSPQPGDLSTMHLWTTRATHDEWRDRVRSSNLKLDGTFVSDGRIHYNVGLHYAGSPNGVTIYDSPTGNPTGYNVALPEDEFFLNVQRLTLDRETTRDATRQRERLMFWFLEKLGLPNLHRRYVHVFFNGVERDQLIIEDVQKPNSDVMEQWFADKGRLTKTNPWFEYGPNGDIINTNPGPRTITNRLETFEHADGSPWTTRDRRTWSHGSAHDDAHDYTGIRSLIAAAQAPEADYIAAITTRADTRQWMRTFAMNDLASYWDTFGNPGSKNAYLFESLDSGTWSVITWDMDVGLGVFNDPVGAALFPANVDPAIVRMYDTPAIVRDYWQALEEALNTFFEAGAGTEVNAIVQETYDVLLANDAAVTSPFAPSGPDGLGITQWIDQRRTFLQNQLAGKNATFTATAPATSSEVFVTVQGTTPLATTNISVNGVTLEPDWSTITAWNAQVALQPGTNTLEILASDSAGNPLGTQTLTVEYTGDETWPTLSINEWMAANPTSSGILDPADNKADDWFELYNPTANAVPLEGWHLSDDLEEPLKFRIPAGFEIPAGSFILIWADNEEAQNDPATRNEIHSNFKLSSGGETIILTAPDGIEIDRIDFADQTSGIAGRRAPDGADTLSFTTTPTPGAANLPTGTPQLPGPITATLTGGDVSVEFQSTTATIYQLETSPDLTDWTSSSAPQAGDGTSLTLTTRPGDTGRLFLRVRVY